MGLGAVIIRQVIDSWNIVSSRAEASSQMNIALSRMSRQIRSVRGRLSVLGASADSFRFVHNDDTNITYNVSGGNLMENGFILIGGVARLRFTYYNATGVVLANPRVYPLDTDISRIAILLEIKTRAGNKARSYLIRPRNLGG